MLVQCYAVKLHEGWSWHFSLDVRVDVHYRSECDHAPLGMVILEPSIAYGQALRLVEELRRSGTLGGTDSHVKNSKEVAPEDRKHSYGYESSHVTEEDLIELQRQLSSALRVCKLPAREQKWRLVLAEKELEADQKHMPVKEHEYRMLVDALAGRALLESEVQSVVDTVCSKMGQDVGLSEHWKSYVQLAVLRGDVVMELGMRVSERREMPYFWREVHTYTCKRCGTSGERIHKTTCIECHGECFYCQACLTMGRVKSCSVLIWGVGRRLDNGIGHCSVNESYANVKQGVSVADGDDVMGMQHFLQPWGLSPAQSAAATAGLEWLRGNLMSTHRGHPASLKNNKSQFLIWAVTGAGKTEMIFPFVGYTLAQGGKVLIATPRRDVVLELAPRIARAFPDQAVVVLYGGSEQRWDSGPITIATTHQLIRFREAYDLVIIDELDAFPYHGDPMLAFAADQACKPGGCTLLLSATPPQALQRDCVRGRLPHVKVPARFHGHPLPVPGQLAIPALRRVLRAGQVPPALLTKLRASLARGAQLFLFVPSIAMVEPLVLLLRSALQAGDLSVQATKSVSAEQVQSHLASPDDTVPLHKVSSNARTPKGAEQTASHLDTTLTIEGTSSKDPLRTEKVQQFRSGEIRILVTTTILERGVTVPKTDVFILDADSKQFDEAALVQMSGRAGRSKDDPAGNVYFAAKERTKAQYAAISQIKSMNKIARKQGFLKEKSN
ncbi:helicase-related protein [Paenibacillus sp. N1-5-1-14]|uniref:DEAD/DEAH box helicase n=1 Tax=Paenibacillus radicibacter TaxID=2972488 RepID=UPI002158F8C2|nr:helicase-related protein [Paenibacillus radicibacter]MCR8645048.1 helicase-related protein [Paenibacillus radicibacter]